MSHVLRDRMLWQDVTCAVWQWHVTCDVWEDVVTGCHVCCVRGCHTSCVTECHVNINSMYIVLYSLVSKMWQAQTCMSKTNLIFLQIYCNIFINLFLFHWLFLGCMQDWMSKTHVLLNDLSRFVCETGFGSGSIPRCKCYHKHGILLASITWLYISHDMCIYCTYRLSCCCICSFSL